MKKTPFYGNIIIMNLRKKIIGLLIVLLICAGGLFSCAEAQISTAEEWGQMIQNTVDMLTKSDANFKIDLVDIGGYDRTAAFVVAENKHRTFGNYDSGNTFDQYFEIVSNNLYAYAQFQEGVWSKMNTGSRYESIGEYVYNMVVAPFVYEVEDAFDDITYDSGLYIYESETRGTIKIKVKNGLISYIENTYTYYGDTIFMSYTFTYGGQSITLPQIN